MMQLAGSDNTIVDVYARFKIRTLNYINLYTLYTGPGRGSLFIDFTKSKFSRAGVAMGYESRIYGAILCDMLPFESSNLLSVPTSNGGRT